MAEYSRFFDSTAEDQRHYTSDEFAEYFRTILTDGIFNGGTNLKVSTNGTSMISDIADGYAWLRGHMYKVEGGHSLTHDVADATNPRIDRIILRLDTSLEVRNINAMILKGEPSATPISPSIIRENNIYDIALAQVLIPANVATIPSENVTDERLDTTVCGLVNSLVQADTTEIFNQFQLWFDNRTAQYEQDWSTWFESIKNATYATRQELVDGLQDKQNQLDNDFAFTEVTVDENELTVVGEYHRPDGTLAARIEMSNFDDDILKYLLLTRTDFASDGVTVEKVRERDLIYQEQRLKGYSAWRVVS